MKFIFKFNETFGFFVFISFLVFLLCMIAGAAILASFLSAVIIYVFLRFAYFLWSLLLKLFGFWRNGTNV